MRATCSHICKMINSRNHHFYWVSLLSVSLFFLAFPLSLASANENHRVSGNAREYDLPESILSQDEILYDVLPEIEDKGKLPSINTDILWRQTMTVDFGRDYGQNLGTLFELFDTEGKALCGAGFNSSVQTRVAINNRVLEFYCRLPEREIKIVDLGKPAKSSTRPVLYQFNNKLLDLATKRAWSAKTRWKTTSYPRVNGNILNVQIVRNKPLYFLRKGLDIIVSYSGKRLARIKTEPLSTLYYDKKVYIFAHDYEDDNDCLYWFEWDSYAGKYALPVEINRIDAPDEMLDVYALYGHEGKLLIAGSGSALYEFSEGTIHKINIDPEVQTHVDPVEGNELYSFITYFDDILIGHFSTGLLLKYSPDELPIMQNSPPLVEDEWQPDSKYYREAQSLAIYGGDLYVGMYPWGRVFRLDRDTNQWSYDRLFDHPETPTGRYPFNETCPEETWGQRITYLVPYRGSLAAGAGSMRKNPQQSGSPLCIPKNAFIDYGRVKLITAPASAMGQLKWTDKPIRLEFIVKKNGLYIYQDGKKIAYTKAVIGEAFFERAGQIDFGYGIYGAINGTILSTVQ
jgi:hypothetical protein